MTSTIGNLVMADEVRLIKAGVGWSRGETGVLLIPAWDVILVVRMLG